MSPHDSGPWRSLAFLVGLASVCLLVAPARAAVDMFLKVPNAPGESTDATHTGDIEVLSFNWGANNPTNAVAPTGGGGSSYGIFQSLTLVKKVDKSTPKLMLMVMNGSRQATVTFYVRSRSASPVEFLKLTLTNVIVSAVQPAGQAAGDNLTESLTLSFSKAKIEYYPINPDGSASALVTSNWDSQTQTGG
jgi:type VI secretion system secreted protein Hcp